MLLPETFGMRETRECFRTDWLKLVKGHHGYKVTSLRRQGAGHQFIDYSQIWQQFHFVVRQFFGSITDY